MPVRNGHAQALRGDDGPLRIDDAPVLQRAPDLQGLFLALLFLAADIGDDVIHDLRHGGERLARARDRLIGGDGGALYPEGAQRVQEGNVGLQRAVALDGNKPALRPQPPALVGNDSKVVGVYFRDDHGHVGRRAVRGVVGHDGHFEFSIPLLERADVLLLHIDGAEHKIDHARNAFGVRLGVEHRHILCISGDGDAHRPFFAHRLAVGLSRRAGARRKCDGGEHRVLVEQR